jgi:tellurite resistance protein TerC
LTGIKVAFASASHTDPAKNPLIRVIKYIIPIRPELNGGSFLVKHNNKWFGTPLLVALLFIEVTDVIFALDSVPAIFAITREPFIVFTSNVFAILGLRALYFLLAGMVSNFHYLKYGLGFILAFVGVKMSWLDHHFGGRFPIGYSLGIIVVSLLLSGIASWLFPPRDKILKLE